MPNSRSNTWRGLLAIGNGVVPLLQQSVFAYAQLYPGSHDPARSADSNDSSSDANCVCSPSACAAIWSIEMPALIS